MNKIGKAIAAGVAVIIIGAIIMVVAVGLNGWKIDDNYEMKVYDAENVVTTIKLDFAVGRIKTQFYDGERVKVEYPENRFLSAACSEANGELTVKTTSKFRWFNFGSLFRPIPEAVISVPKGSEPNLDFTVNAGTVDIAEGTYGDIGISINAGTVNLNDTICGKFSAKLNAGTFNAGKLTAATADCVVNAGLIKMDDVACGKFIGKVNAGKIDLSKLKCDDIMLNLDAGNIEIKVDGIKSDYTVTAKVDAGSCNLSSQKGNDPSKQISIDVDAGNAIVNFN